MVTPALWGVIGTTFLAASVECVEALTIVLAMGVIRGWESALWGTGAALATLAACATLAGYALTHWVPEAALQLGIGTLLLIFGLQWLRKAIRRSAGLQARRDEAAEFQFQTAATAAASAVRRFGLDWVGVVIAFKGVFLEGIEVVFLVITFGLAAHAVPLAAVSAATAAVLVTLAGVVVRRPLSRVPENTLKYGVGLLLATFGTFWAVEGLGIVTGASLAWPGGEATLLPLLAGWYLLSRLLIWVLPTLERWRAAGAARPVQEGA
jgi:Ca2+/H+ antiporter, TMEM165/GDT1 family